MKVLMFGWEFPPHISGGLGTACYGLTNSLGKEAVDVLFVVPKVHGDEPAENINLINASNVAVHNGPSKGIRLPNVSNTTVYTTSTGKEVSVQEASGFTYIEVPSGLVAYRSPEFAESADSVSHWNHQHGEAPMTVSSNETKNNIANRHATQRSPYAFSGAYGPNLLMEVEKYAQVASELAKKFSFDVIHAHDWMTYPAGIAAKEASGKPLIVHVHATEYDRSGSNVDTRVHAIEMAGMHSADCVVTVSDWTKKIAITKYNVPKDKVQVVHNGIISKKKEEIKFESPLKRSPIVTFLGRITHQKGPLYFVEAAKAVLAEIPDARFIVAGSGDLLPKMIQQVAKAGMSSRFHFTGFVKGQDIERIWSISNVYVMPSVSEPFGIAPLEAIQAGVPVIISKQSGVAEVMPHAIAVDFWDTSALAEAICSVLKYKSLYQTLKRNSKAQIKGITWDRAAKRLNNLYHELTEQQ
ncbi:MAG TPA: glycosyltransferase [Chryseosolibacter sp.]|nr:glycosyltransferase [Chryseosolibacter sp.]